MKTRIISALVALPLLIIFVVLGGLPLKIGVTLVALIGLFEFYKAFSGFITVSYTHLDVYKRQE